MKNIMNNEGESGDGNSIDTEPSRARVLAVAGEGSALRALKDNTGVIQAAASTRIGERQENQDGFIIGDSSNDRFGVVVDAMGGGRHGLAVVQIVVKIIAEKLQGKDHRLFYLLANAAAELLLKKREYQLDEKSDGAVITMARDEGTQIEGLTLGDSTFYIIDLTEQRIAKRSHEQSTLGDLLHFIESNNPDSALQHFMALSDSKAFNDCRPVLDDRYADWLRELLSASREKKEPIPDETIDQIRGEINTKLHFSAVTHAIMADRQEWIDCRQIVFQKVSGHRYLVLLCSDGVTRSLTDSQLLQICLRANNPLQVVKSINAAINSPLLNAVSPASDNYTTVAFLA